MKKKFKYILVFLALALIFFILGKDTFTLFKRGENFDYGEIVLLASCSVFGALLIVLKNSTRIYIFKNWRVLAAFFPVSHVILENLSRFLFHF